MKYTDTRPTEPGWYWLKRTQAPAAVTVVKVFRQSGLLCVRDQARRISALSHVIQSEWAGPIPRPLPPDAV